MIPNLHVLFNYERYNISVLISISIFLYGEKKVSILNCLHSLELDVKYFLKLNTCMYGPKPLLWLVRELIVSMNFVLKNVFRCFIFIQILRTGLLTDNLQYLLK